MANFLAPLLWLALAIGIGFYSLTLSVVFAIFFIASVLNLWRRRA